MRYTGFKFAFSGLCRQDASKTPPRRFQDASKTSKTPPRCPQDAFKTPPRRPKAPPRRPKGAPKTPQDGFMMPSRGPRGLQECPKTVQVSPKATPRRPKMRFHGLPWPKIDMKIRFGGESTMQGRGGDKSTPLVQGKVGIYYSKNLRLCSTRSEAKGLGGLM